MLSISEAEARAAALVERAARAGADAADAVYIADASTAVQVRLGELEDVARNEAESDRPALLRRPPLGERLLLRPVRRSARALWSSGRRPWRARRRRIPGPASPPRIG